MEWHKLKPAFVPSPGEILTDELEARGWSQPDFASMAGMSQQEIEEVIKNNQISRQTALKISKAFGTSPELWLGLAEAYEEHCVSGGKS